jgi:hypothetical protein
MYNHLNFIKDNLDDKDRNKFSELEYEKFLRVVKYMEKTQYPQEKIIEGRTDFYNWFTEYDKRRGTNFKNTFPNLINFMESCEHGI